MLQLIPAAVLREQVFACLNVKGILSCRSSCHYLNKSTRENGVWKGIVQRRSFLLQTAHDSRCDFKSYYERLYRQLSLKYRLLSKVKTLGLNKFWDGMYCPSYAWELVREGTPMPSFSVYTTTTRGKMTASPRVTIRSPRYQLNLHPNT